jgi:hypothetical protein
MTDARWRAERIGPAIMAAPHRGQAHVVAVSVGGRRRGRVGGSVCDRGRSEEVSRQRDPRGSTGVGQKARLPDAHEAPRQDVLDEAAEKFHGRERYRAALIAMGIVLPVEGDVVAVEGDQR